MGPLVSVGVDKFADGSMPWDRLAAEVGPLLISRLRLTETAVELLGSDIWSPYSLLSSPTLKKDLELSSELGLEHHHYWKQADTRPQEETFLWYPSGAQMSNSPCCIACS